MVNVFLFVDPNMKYWMGDVSLDALLMKHGMVISAFAFQIILEIISETVSSIAQLEHILIMANVWPNAELTNTIMVLSVYASKAILDLILTLDASKTVDDSKNIWMANVFVRMAIEEMALHNAYLLIVLLT